MSVLPGTCPNCGATQMQRYCPECGERALSVQDLELRHFLTHDLAHETFHVDGKLPRTLRVLATQPGMLAVDFVAGRRTRHANPVRLYLLAFVLHAVLTSWLPAAELSLPLRAQREDPSGWISRLASRRDVTWDDPAVQARLAARGHWLAEGGTLLIFLGVAGIQQLLLRRLRRRYMEHAVLALSVTTFYLLLAALLEIVDAAFSAHLPNRGAELVAGMVLNVVFVVYWYLSIRRFYGVSRGAAVGATFVVVLAQTLLAMALNLAVLALLVATA